MNEPDGAQMENEAETPTIPEIDVVKIGDMSLWLRSLPDAEKPLWLLLQGYPYTGFAALGRDRIDIPGADREHLQPEPFRLAWNYYWDLRAFNEAGEWHAWRDSRLQWRARRQESIPKEDTASQIIRKYPLWGAPSGARQNQWVEFADGRGISVWAPVPFGDKRWKTTRLEVGQVIGCDPETGLAYISDAYIRCFTPEDGK